ncbi:MAG: hypothetical protein QNK04_31400 [Myxococcota bacterium]|nr:hypothetical protein [Myxococcota bacterium]
MTPTKRVARRPALALLATFAIQWGLAGCQSVRSWQDCPGVYSGVRYYSDQRPELPVDGKIFFSLDLPLTAVADTLALPATAFAKPSRRTGGYPVGCRWARHGG